MKYDRFRGKLSNMIRVFIPDNTLTNGGGLTGLVFGSTNLTIAFIRELDGAATTYTGANIQTVTTIGTFQQPTDSAHCRFKAVDATNFPGVYEIHFHDSATIFGTGDASVNVQVNVYEASTSALHIGPNMAEIRLIAWDMQTALASSTIGTVTTLTGNTAQTGDAFARLGVAGAGLTALGDARLANLDAAVSTRSTLGGTAQTGDNYARIGAPAGGTISADIAAVNAKTTNLPAAPASTTNITAGTITTVTNLTNAPTAGDFTAAMKSSITAAAPTASAIAAAVLAASIESGVSLKQILEAIGAATAGDYDPATGSFKAVANTGTTRLHTVLAGGARTNTPTL